MNDYVFIFDGLADWEIGLITYELNTNNRIPIKAISVSKEPIKTGGGLTVLPDMTLDDIDPNNTDLLILPGGEMWHHFEHPGLTNLINHVHLAGGIIAGICAASLFLVKMGLMDGGVRHTSNGLDYIKYYFPEYNLQDYYIDSITAVSDQGIITAPGEAPFEFAYQILKAQSVYDDDTLNEFAEVWCCRGL